MRFPHDCPPQRLRRCRFTLHRVWMDGGGAGGEVRDFSARDVEDIEAARVYVSVPDTSSKTGKTMNKQEPRWPSGEKSYAWKGGRSLCNHGHLLVLRPDHPDARKSGYIYEHRLRATEALGKPLPENVVVHHHTPKEIVICQDQAYHRLLHRRQRALEACGHASWRKCWVCKEYDSPENIYVIGDTSYHKKCKNAYDRGLKAAKRARGCKFRPKVSVAGRKVKG